MESFLLQAMLMFLIMGTGFSQVDTFYDESNQATAFTLGAFNFARTGDQIIEAITILTILDKTCSFPNCLKVHKMSVFEQN